MGSKTYMWLGIMILVTVNVEVYSLNFENLLLPDLKNRISSHCYKDLQNKNQNMKHFNMEAISAWNAASPGFINGAHDYTGDYKTCLEPLPHDPNVTIPQYCVFDVLVTYRRSCALKSPTCTHDNETDNIIAAPKWALCAPKSCNQSDLLQLADVMLKKSPLGDAGLPFKVYSWDHACQTAETKPLSFETIAFLCLTGTLVTLVIACTLYHWSRAKKYSEVEVSPLILNWSLIENFPPLFSLSSSEIMVFHRVRVIAIGMILILHLPVFFLMAPLHNVGDITRFFNLTQYIRLDLVTDVFIAMGGFLLGVNVPTKQERTPGNKSVIKLVIKRYIRILPSLAMVIFFIVSSAQYMTAGPYWHGIVGAEQEMCKKHWLSTLLLVANYGKWSEYCWLPTWYLPVDFHCFLLGIYFASVIKRNNTRGVAIFISIIVGSTFILGYQIYYNNLFIHPPYLTDLTRYPRKMIHFEHSYIKTHMRLPAYFIGLLFGYIASVKRAKKEFISQNAARFGYVLALAIIVITISIGTTLISKANVNIFINALYGSILRPFMGLGASILFMVWALQSNDSKVSVMDRYFWTPLSKLSFGIYLVHMSFEMSTAGSSQQPYYFNNSEMTYFLLRDAMNSIIASLFLYLFVEIPCAGMLKIILKENRKPGEKTKEE